MKLFYAVGSPYARIIRVVLRETGLIARIAEEEVTLRDPNSALLAYNPGGKVPSLELDNGTIINESLLVLAYLDTQHEGSRLLPMDGADGWKILAEVGRAYAFLDAVTVWNRELRFGLKAPGVIALKPRGRSAPPMRSRPRSARAAMAGRSMAVQSMPGRSCSARPSKTSPAATRYGRGARAGRASPRFSTRSRGTPRSPRRYSRKSRSSRLASLALVLLPGGISATPSPRSAHRTQGA